MKINKVKISKVKIAKLKIMKTKRVKYKEIITHNYCKTIPTIEQHKFEIGIKSLKGFNESTPTSHILIKGNFLSRHMMESHQLHDSLSCVTK